MLLSESWTLTWFLYWTGLAGGCLADCRYLGQALTFGSSLPHHLHLHWLGVDYSAYCQLNLQTSHLIAAVPSDMRLREIEMVEDPSVPLCELRGAITRLQFHELAERGPHTAIPGLE